jgi:molybdenum cofactor cytidylyltransferase
MLAAAILAAGESRRMGQPKALLPYRGATFLEHLLQITRHPRIDVQRAVLGAGAEAIRAQLRLTDEQVVVNNDWERGQLSSIQAAIRSLTPGQAEGLLICPVDHPLVSSHLIGDLIRAFDASGKGIALPIYEGRRGHPVIFGAKLYGELLAAADDLGARQIVRAHPEDIVEVPTQEEGVVLNLNDPETMLRAMGE